LNSAVSLSILIPVYNFNVTSLVNELVSQLSNTGKEGEIILLDDASVPSVISTNAVLQELPGVSFYYNEKNEGRMASRQQLSQLARYDYLLFLDCDSGIIREDFVSTYFKQIEKRIALTSGGRIYNTEPPAEKEYILHWKYGTVRESRKPGNANEPGFMSNNFLILKELFGNLDNYLELPGYGHEDSWWGIQFEQAGVQCQYINNPVLHSSLEKAEIFLAKSENALTNLLLLEKNIGIHLLSRHVKIFRWYARLKKTGLPGIYLFIESLLHNYFRKNLLSSKPRLLFFDCYRLAVLIRKGKSFK
jgi:glycosyltransferase involved in cell wall biosynthesis